MQGSRGEGRLFRDEHEEAYERRPEIILWRDGWEVTENSSGDRKVMRERGLLRLHRETAGDTVAVC